jgi:DNA-binding LytR/AlgR family response regulator
MTSTPINRRSRPDLASAVPAGLRHAGFRGHDEPGEPDQPGALGGRRPRGHSSEKLMLRLKGRLVLVDKASIDWIDAVGNYVRFNVAGETYQVRATLNDVEQALPAGRFMRMHRSTIVNLDAVKEFVRVPYGDLVALLKNGKRLTVGRRYRTSLAAALDALAGFPGAR